MEDRHISLAHGNGGRYMRELIEWISGRPLANPALDTRLDAAPLALAGDLVPFITKDSFAVQSLEFPGGDIGSLAVKGTINGLAVSGAVPKFLTLNAIIEEGLEVACLDRVVGSLCGRMIGRCQGGGGRQQGRAARAGWRALFCGHRYRPAPARRLPGNGSDPRGGRATCPRPHRRSRDIRHAGARGVRLARRGHVGLRAGDAAGRADHGDDRRAFHARSDAGGLAAVAHEIAQATSVDVRLSERQIPVRDSVRSVCAMLGYDPYYLACEGRVVTVAAPEVASDILAICRGLAGGEGGCMVGRMRAGSGHVVLDTEIGGEGFLEELEDDPLPRIC